MPLDSQIKNLALAIRQHESGGKYDAPGASGEYGAYQFMPSTWDGLSKKYLGTAIPLQQADRIQQNKVAYSYLKELSDKGYKPSQIAAVWNAGEGSLQNDKWKTNVGVNKAGVKFDTPAYVRAVAKYYKEFSGGMAPTEDISSTAPVSTAPTQIEKPTSIGQKILKGVSYLGGGPEFAEDIFGALQAKGDQKLFDEATKQTAEIAANIVTRMQEKEKKGEDTSRLRKALQQLLDDAPQINEFLPDVVNKTPAQILADFAQLGLAVGTTAIPGAATVPGRILSAGVVGGAMGGTGAVQSGSTDWGEIATSAAVGSAIGAATGGLFEAGAAALKGAKNFLRGGRTPAEIMSVPESELSKLSSKERQYRFSEETKVRNEEFRQKNNKIKADLDKSAEQSAKVLKDLSEDLRVRAADADTAPVRTKVKEHMGDANKKYGQQLKEALAPVEDLPVSNKELNEAINQQFLESPEKAKELRDLLGIKDADFITNKQGVTESQNTTVGELFDNVRDLKSEVGKAAKSGSRALTAEEYKKSEATDFLMDFIHKKAEGTQFSEIMSKANDDWKVWAHLRNRIFKDLKPFGVEQGQEIPFKKILVNVAKGKGTSDMTYYIKQLEDMIGEPIGKETQAAFAKLDAEKQAMVLTKSQADIAKENLRLEKLAVEKDWRVSKLKAEQQAQSKATIKKYLKWALGLSAVGAFGGDKIIEMAL